MYYGARGSSVLLKRMVSTRSCYYALLGVCRTATAEEVHRAYLYRAKIYHPDSGSELADKGRFQALVNAHGILCDPTLRRQYDQETTKQDRNTNIQEIRKEFWRRWKSTDPATRIITLNQLRQQQQAIKEATEAYRRHIAEAMEAAQRRSRKFS